jgi:hypothetical protein
MSSLAREPAAEPLLNEHEFGGEGESVQPESKATMKQFATTAWHSGMVSLFPMLLLYISGARAFALTMTKRESLLMCGQRCKSNSKAGRSQERGRPHMRHNVDLNYMVLTCCAIAWL